MHSVRSGASAPPSPFPHDAPTDPALDLGASYHDILTTAEGSPRLGMFVDFMRAAALARLLAQPESFTVFAPTDRAFLKLSLRQRDALLADNERLVRVMRSHIALGVLHLPSPDDVVASIDGDQLSITSVDGVHAVELCRIVQANIRASNGVIHAIDSLLL